MAGTGVGKYSTTPSSNQTVQSTNWAEGMAPSDVNNAARETLSNIRSAVNDIAAGYVELGDTDGVYTVTKIDADTFTINTASDLRTDYYQVGRKIKITHTNGVTSGTIESTAYSSPTLTVNLSGANITGASISKVELGLPSAGGAANFDMDDNAKIRVGDSQDLEVYHDGTDSFIENNTGELYVQGNNITVRSDTSTETFITMDKDDGVDLFFNNSKRLETTNAGATVTGDLTITGSVTAGGNNIVQNAYPVGSIYMNASVSTNPGTLLGFGTWVEFGEGRMLIGEDGTYSAGDTGGSTTHTLTQANLPDITLKTTEFVKIEETPESAPNGSGTGNKGSSSGSGAAYNKADVETGGSDTPINHLPPYIAVYMWKRTA